MATDANGDSFGIEVKSGSSVKTPMQRAFDKRLNSGGSVHGVGNGKGISLTGVLDFNY